MRRIVFCIVLGISSLAPTAISKAQQRPPPPEAEPVYNWIKAARSGDVALLKTVWTSETFKGYFGGESYDWQKELKASRKFWREMLGVRNLQKVRLEDVKYTVKSQVGVAAGLKVVVSEREKIVYVIYKGKQRESFNVEYEDGKWKIPEK
jgi:hypothetical protein